VLDFRGLAILLFGVAAVLVGIGNSDGSKWLQAAAYILFAFGVLAVLRWRRGRARVLDHKEKTSSEEEPD
jgi:membrane protein implicated in regulation of membrane protease activity